MYIENPDYSDNDNASGATAAPQRRLRNLRVQGGIHYVANDPKSLRSVRSTFNSPSDPDTVHQHTEHLGQTLGLPRRQHCAQLVQQVAAHAAVLNPQQAAEPLR